MAKSWLSKQWTAWGESYDADEVSRGSQPIPAAFAVVSLTGVLSVIAFVPPIAEASQFQSPWISIVLTWIGGAFTFLAGRFRARGPLGQIGALLDNGFYSAALMYAACATSNQYALGLAIVHGLMVLALPAQAYGLSLPFAALYLTPLVVLLSTMRPRGGLSLIFICTYILFLLTSFLTGKRLELVRRNVQLTQAVSATQRIADESVQTALTTTLLSLGNFLHELKSYQSTVRTNLTYLDETLDADPDAREAIAEAIGAQEGEIKLVRTTMETLSKSARPTDAEFELGELIASVAKGTVGVQVVVKPSPQPLRVRGVAEHLTIVLTNLIRNAEQAGGTIVTIETGAEAAGHSVRVLVRDNGPGIPETVRERLFEPFGMTTKKGGTGLGLYLCRRHVELFGGNIRVQRSDADGTDFLIMLPTGAAPEAAPS